MSDGARYRQRAREFEQRESWKRAIEAYELAIEADKRGRKDIDLALYNRIGDLYRRIGDSNKAVHYYELAVDGHLAAGFYNNAIALCNKILRNQPNRHSAYLKLGKIGAAKGFLSDARKHFLEYAERMQKANKLDQAFAALIEFANLSPDPEVRLVIADQLVEHGRSDMAVEQLRLVWRDLKQEGRDADADEVRQRVLGRAPHRDPEVEPPEEDVTAAGIDAEGILELPEILPYDEPEPEVITQEQAREADVAELRALDEVEAESGLSVESLEIVPTSLEDSRRGPELAKEGSTSEDVLEILPNSLMAQETSEAEVAEGEELVLEEEEDLAAPIETGGEFAEQLLGDWPGAEAGPSAAEEPQLVVEEPPAPVDRVTELGARLAAEGRKPGLLFELGEALLESGEPERGTARLREAADLYEAQGAFREAGRVLEELLRLDVNDVLSYQKRVELALRAGERAQLLEAYLDLADCLDRTDAGNKARAVYARVLELDPQNHRAATALEMLNGDATTAVEPAASRRGATTGEDYVDVRSLVLEEGTSERSTRFRVPTADPQSEADVNFAEMLGQFKSKVAEAIEKEDAASHYDLGCAFKDMGLIDEAVTEFQIAARTLDYRLRAIEMLGECFLEKEDYRIALKVLSRALQISAYREGDLVGIYYALGRANEGLGQTDTAVEWYERVMGSDVNFRDAGKRVTILRN